MEESTLQHSDQAVVVALGSNLKGGFESTQALLEAAVTALNAAGLRVVGQSRWWRSAAWPNPADPPYLNGVVTVETERDVAQTLTAMHAVEASFGRVRQQANAPRTLDLDLIAHGRSIVSQGGIIVPHPRAAQRLFVMGPLAEIAPEWRHPVLGATAAELAAGASVGTDAVPQRS